LAEEGVPERMSVILLNVTPFGSLPSSVILGGGVPAVVTKNESTEPTLAVVLVALVKQRLTTGLPQGPGAGPTEKL
jgi:hypothetical protein